MKPLISPSAMLESERRYFEESGVPSLSVMERAAQALANAIADDLPEDSTLFFACGPGGNGGDGTACARMLSRRYRCTIVQLQPPTAPDAIKNLNRAEAAGIRVLTDFPTEHPDAWADALFGTGLSRAPSGQYARLVRRINDDRRRGARVYCADIPSGLSGATGVAYDPCIRADLTVTFHCLKTGLTMMDGLDVCGKILTEKVGFPEGFGPLDAMLMEPADLPKLLPLRPRNIHKGRCGHLLIVAGSFGMAGAAALCAMAALRSGAGLVSIACPRSIVSILQTLTPQALCVPLDEEDGAICESALPALKQALKEKTAVVIGCGLTRRVPFSIVEAVLESGLPAVVDADALNILSARPDRRDLLRPQHVLTPHPGEAVRLLPDLPSTDSVASARALAALGATVLYKGAASVICGGSESFVSASGSNGMARGGSGDILSGIIGALLAEPSDRSPAQTAAAASEVHGLAGELAQRRYSSRSMNSRDILEFLPEVFGR